MELYKAFELAVILAWDDLSKVAAPSLVRVEYEFTSRRVSHLSVWLIKPKGYQDLVYQYWAKASWGYPAGGQFANGHDSKPLVLALTFVLSHTDQFEHTGDAPKQRVLVHPPSEDERREAAIWKRGLAMVAAGAVSAKQNDSQREPLLAECVK